MSLSCLVLLEATHIMSHLRLSKCKLISYYSKGAAKIGEKNPHQDSSQHNNYEQLRKIGSDKGGFLQEERHRTHLMVSQCQIGSPENIHIK